MDIMKTKAVLHCLLGSLLLLVACTDEGSLSFSHAGSTVTLPAEAGAYVEIPFTCDAGWQATTDAEWLKVSPQSGAGGSHELTLTVSSPNNSGGLRSATLKVTSGSSGQTFTVRQDEYIRLEQEVYEIPVEGGNLDIRFATTLAADEFAVYSVTGVDWVHGRASSRVAETGYLVPLTADPNGGGQERVAYYYFVKESDRFTTDRNARILATATVVQKGSQSGQESADYSQDRKVKTLQTHTEGEGIPLVLMGDGFMDVDIAGGYYDEVMARAMDNLFTEEPVRSLRGYFDVYSVTAVSRRNSFTSGDGTAFGCTFEGGNSTGIYGDTDKVLDYAGEVEGIDPQEALSVVILNTNTYGGTTYNFYSGTAPRRYAVAFCPVIESLESETFRQVLVHEAIGHGFGKLMDEYAYEENGAIPGEEVDHYRHLQGFGWARNVDFTDDPARVLWADFLSDSRYAGQGLGVYEGACTYAAGAYRSTEESMMRSNIQGFNAPSRYALYRFVMEYGEGRTPDYEEFVAFDRQTFTAKTRAAGGGATRPFGRTRWVNLDRDR